jgi:hypothetical protein
MERINKSEDLLSEIILLTERIKQIRSSGHLLEPERMNQIKIEVEAKKKALEESYFVRNEISIAEKYVDFLTDFEIKELEKELNNVQLIFKTIQSSLAPQGDCSHVEMNDVLQV